MRKYIKTKKNKKKPRTRTRQGTKQRTRQRARARSRAISMANVGGGFKNGYTCEGVEGCVLKNGNVVTKIYKKTENFVKEVAGFNLFEQVDPAHNYHGEMLDQGDITYDNIPIEPYIKQNIFTAGKTYKFLNLEFVGASVLDLTATTDNTPCFKMRLIEFFLTVLNLRLTSDYMGFPSGSYVIHTDPHAGNICYQMNADGCPTIKYIDLSSVAIVDPAEIVVSGTDIMNQFIMMKETIKFVFRSVNPIITPIIDLLQNPVGQHYSDMLAETIEALHQVRINLDNPELVAEANLVVAEYDAEVAAQKAAEVAAVFKAPTKAKPKRTLEVAEPLEPVSKRLLF